MSQGGSEPGALVQVAVSVIFKSWQKWTFFCSWNWLGKYNFLSLSRSKVSVHQVFHVCLVFRWHLRESGVSKTNFSSAKNLPFPLVTVVLCLLNSDCQRISSHKRIILHWQPKWMIFAVILSKIWIWKCVKLFSYTHMKLTIFILSFVFFASVSQRC